MRRTILYYPSIEIPDGDWLRTSLLYWDEISSIVPRDVERSLYSNSKIISQLKEEGEYRPFYPDQLMNSNYYRDFEKECINRIKAYTRIGNYNKVDKNIYKTITEREKVSNSYDIHKDKIFFSVKEVLEGHRLISRDEDWMALDDVLANIYMATLAKYSALSDINFTVIGSDQIPKVNDIYPTIYSQNKPNPYKTPVLNLSFNILPTPSPDVPYERILKFKRKYRGELIEFRKTINEFEEKMSNSESEYDLKEKTVRFHEIIQLRAMETMKMLKGDRINFFLSSLKSVININSPTMFATCAGILGHELTDISPTIILSGIGVASAIDITVNYLSINKSTRDKLSDKGFLYLYYATNKKIMNDFI
jgi:hypothetical protein